MGKDSLIKSTSKKKKTSSAKKDEDNTKVKAKKTSTTKKSTAKAKKSTKTAPKKAKSAAKTKSSAKPKTKKKTTAKTKAAPKKKTAAKAKTAPKAKKTVKKPKKKVSIKELTHKKFDLWETAKPSQVKTAPQTPGNFAAPSFFATSDKDELKRLKALLLQKYDYDMLIKASEAAAAEKAAAEKAEAEKATAEKAATEKAEAEKAAAEKAAQEKKAAEPKPTISYKPPPDIPAPSDPADKMMTYGIGGLLLLIFLLVGASFLNADNYYIKPVNGAIEIWQGKFTPKGDRLLMSLPGEKLVTPLKSVYDKKEVFPLIFAHYRDKAVTLMEVKGMPDFDAEKAYLEKALAYSTTSAEKAAAKARINTIDLMVLLSRADAAASRNTVEDLTTALKHLDEAAGLDLDDIQKKQVQHKTDQVKSRMTKVKQQEAKAKEAAKKAQKAKKQAAKKDVKKKKSAAEPAKSGQKADTKNKEGKTDKHH